MAEPVSPQSVPAADHGCLGGPLGQGGSESVEWMVVIRVYGAILGATGKWGGKEGCKTVPLTEAHIDAMMQLCAEAGVTTVLWRANCAGTLTYPSKFAPLPGEPPLPDPNCGMGIASVKQGWPPEDWPFLGEQCRRFNTLAAAVTAAHRHGLKFYLDFNTFDMVGSWCTRATWPAGGDRAWNPDLWLWSRDHKQRLAGIPCYADPRVRDMRAGEIAEALDYDIDGVMLGLFSHVDIAAGDEPCRFGYNPIVVEEYKRRHGADPLSDEVDVHGFYALHGEYFTMFVRQVADLVHARGGKLTGMARTDGVHGWGGWDAGAANRIGVQTGDLRDGRSDLPLLAGGMYLEWEKWADERLVDGLMFMGPPRRNGAGVEAVRGAKQRVSVPVYLWRRYPSPPSPDEPDDNDQPEEWLSEIQAVRNGAIDGYCLSISFEDLNALTA